MQLTLAYARLWASKRNKTPDNKPCVNSLNAGEPKTGSNFCRTKKLILTDIHISVTGRLHLVRNLKWRIKIKISQLYTRFATLPCEISTSVFFL